MCFLDSRAGVRGKWFCVGLMWSDTTLPRLSWEAGLKRYEPQARKRSGKFFLVSGAVLTRLRDSAGRTIPIARVR
jgi:hypothetical protein